MSEVPQQAIATDVGVPEAPQKVTQVEPTAEVNTQNGANATLPPESSPQLPAAEVKTQNADVPSQTDTVKVEDGKTQTESTWQSKENDLLKVIEQLESVEVDQETGGLELELKMKQEEVELLKARVRNLETEVEAALSRPGDKNQEMIDNIKEQHEELLTKARGMICDKTKMVKNMELQIEALSTQVQSLKDINTITKDMLEIRNSEVKSLEERLQAMEGRFKAEKERFTLVVQRAETSSHLNDDLKKEYDTQLAIFKELREKYEQRVTALVAENNRLKETIAASNTS